MSATIITSVLTGGTNSYATTSTQVNGVASDFLSHGVTGPTTSTSGVAPSTGSYAVNAQGTPNMTVAVAGGVAWITATPSGQVSQKLRAYSASGDSAYTINANTSGSTKYDWIYLKVDPTAANNPASDGSDVTALYTSRSSSNSTDNGSPPTYGVLLAVVTVANSASSISNSNIADKRITSSFRSSPATNAVNTLDIASAATGSGPTITAQGTDSNIDINFATKGAGAIKGVVNNLYNPYKFSAYRSSSYTVGPGPVLFNTKNFDTSSNYDVTTGHFTATIAGFYQFNASLEYNTNAAPQDPNLNIWLNGTTQLMNQHFVNMYNGASTSALSASVFVQLAANDYVYVSGTAGYSVAITGQCNSFSGFLVSAT